MTADLEHTVVGFAAVRRIAEIEEIARLAACREAEVVAILLPVVENALDAAGEPQWSLRAQDRRAVFARTPRSTVLRWLAHAPPKDSLDEIARRWVVDGVVAGSHITELPELVRHACSWFEDCAWIEPAVAQVRQELELHELGSRLRKAAGSVFTGRLREIAVIRSYIANRGMLVIEARGGMGKSALLARALLAEGAYSEHGPLVAWLDFDSPVIDVREPETILFEMMRQLALQQPALRPLEARLREDIQLYQREKSSHQRVARRAQEDDRFWVVARHLLSRLSVQRPMVVVLDTFERAQHVSRALADQLIYGLVPVLHGTRASLIVAGRGPLRFDIYPQEERVELQALDRLEALECLACLGLDPRTARKVANLVRGTPLTLHLAARAVQGLGEAPFPEPELRWAIQRELVDGFLHARILSHLPSRRLAEVARIACLLHSITPRSLTHIVGPMVDPAISSEEAVRLHDELAGVSDLVSLPTRGVLRLRPELAAELLALLGESDPAMVRELHTRTVGYLGTRETLDESEWTELVLHLLALGRIDQAGTHMTAARQSELAVYLPALPSDAQQWLRPFTEAFDSRLAEKRAGALLAAARPLEALAVIDAAKQRTRTLHVLEARAAIELGQRERARKAIAGARGEGPDPELSLLELRLDLESRWRLRGSVAGTLVAATLAIAASYWAPRSAWAIAYAVVAAALPTCVAWVGLLIRERARVDSAVELRATLSRQPLPLAELGVLLARMATMRLRTVGRAILVDVLSDSVAWQAVLDGNLDLARQVVVALGTPTALQRALEDGLYDRPGVRFTPIARKLAALHIAIPATSAIGTSVSSLNEELQKLAARERAGSVLAALWSANPERLSRALFEVLAAPVQLANTARGDRASLLEELARLMETRLTIDARAGAIALGFGAALSGALSSREDDDLWLRRALTRIDRDGRGSHLAAALAAHPEIERVAATLWPVSAPAPNHGLSV